MTDAVNPIVHSLALSNFEGIQSLQIDFHPKLTVVAGRNAVGKTRLLRALNKAAQDENPNQTRFYKLSRQPDDNVATIFLSENRNLIKEQAFYGWLNEKDAEEARQIRNLRDLDYKDREMEIVRDLVSKIDGFSGISIRNGSVIFDKNNTKISESQLSSGEKMLFLFGVKLFFVMSRWAINSHKRINQFQGLVLIDEIELHLHPAWQREVCSFLTSAFPKCQFVVTTHSPQVIGGVQSQQVRMLTSDTHGNVSVKIPTASYGRDSNYILEGLFEVDDRDPAISLLIEQVEKSIDDGEFDQAERLLEQLGREIEGDAPIVNLLRARLSRVRRQVEAAN